MFLSVFDIFKVGVGPSSSHTVGPMVAAGRFLAALRDGVGPHPRRRATPARLGCRLHGSLAFTGKGHATDRAVTLGLAGFDPADFDAGRAAEALERIAATGRIAPPGLPEMAFDAGRDLVFDYGPPLPGHANGLVLSAWDAARQPAHAGDLLFHRRRLRADRARARPPAARRRRAGGAAPVPLGGRAARAHPLDRPLDRRAAARQRAGAAAGGRDRRRPRPALGGDDGVHRPRPRAARASCPAGSRSAAAPAASTSGSWPSAGRT